MRFLLFAGPQHYPSGGWLDLHSTHDTELAAHAAARDLVDGGIQIVDWWHIVDARSARVVRLYDIPILDAENLGAEATAREVGPHTFVQPDDDKGMPDWAIRCAHCGHPATLTIHDGAAA